MNLRFRPLTGTLLSKLRYAQEQENRQYVSVPSRGLSYLNKAQITICQRKNRFRPLTGTLLSKL